MISLRTLLVLIAVLAVWFGWITNRARRQAEVVAQLKAEGSDVHFDYEYPPGSAIDEVPLISNAKPPGPVWLRRWFGEEYFRKIVTVTWNGSGSTRAVSRTTDDIFLDKLTSLEGLRNLEISGRNVNSRALANAPGLESLEVLSFLNCPSVSDDIFPAMARMPRLRSLFIANCPLYADSFTEIDKLRGLKRLVLFTPNLSDDGVARISAIRGLESLEMGISHITDKGLARLELPKLKFLRLHNRRVTGVGLASIAMSGQLEHLELTCSATDEGIAVLRPLKKLTALDVFQTGGSLSDRALESLQELSSLEHLFLNGSTRESTRFTNSALLKLTDSLPALKSLSLGRCVRDKRLLIPEIRNRHPKLDVAIW